MDQPQMYINILLDTILANPVQAKAVTTDSCYNYRTSIIFMVNAAIIQHIKPARHIMNSHNAAIMTYSTD